MTLAPVLLALSLSASASPSGSGAAPAPSAPSALGEAGSALRSASAYDGSRERAEAVFAGDSAAKPLPKGMMTAEQAKALWAKRRIPVAELIPVKWFKDEAPAAPAEAAAQAESPAPSRSAPLDAAADALGGVAGAALGAALGMGLAYGLSRVAARA